MSEQKGKVIGKRIDGSEIIEQDPIPEAPVETPKADIEKIKDFQWCRIVHGGKEICEKLHEFKRKYRLIHWDFEPNGNQYLLIVEVEPKDN